MINGQFVIAKEKSEDAKRWRIMRERFTGATGKQEFLDGDIIRFPRNLDIHDFYETTEEAIDGLKKLRA